MVATGCTHQCGKCLHGICRKSLEKAQLCTLHAGIQHKNQSASRQGLSNGLTPFAAEDAHNLEWPDQRAGQSGFPPGLEPDKYQPESQHCSQDDCLTGRPVLCAPGSRVWSRCHDMLVQYYMHHLCIAVPRAFLWQDRKIDVQTALVS